MYIAPDTYVKLVRFDVTKEHQLTFSDIQTQKTFFDNLPGLVLSDFTYQRKDSVIRYPALYEDIEKYNYCIYCNEAQSDKYYYCYITNMKYINDEMTEITIETDVFQTWQFDIIYKSMFIEREHVNSDVIGEHTVPEILETGEYVINAQNAVDQMQLVCYMVLVTKDVNGVDTQYATNLGGIPTSKGVYLCKTAEDVLALIQQYVTNGVSTDSIINIYAVPRMFVDEDFSSFTSYERFVNQPYPKRYEHYLVPKPANLNGYVPINKKLMTYPYCYLAVTNNMGSTNILHFEKFLSNECLFTLEGVPTEGGSIRIYPENYGKVGYEPMLEQVIAGKYPTLDWNVDYYANWLLTNSSSLNTNYAYGGAGIALGMIGVVVAGLMSGGLASAGLFLGSLGGAVGGASKIESTMASVRDHEKIPNTSRGSAGAGDIMTASGWNKFGFYEYTIKEEYAKMIDDYFTMYGYKVNSVKLPNITGRQNWNYVKTTDCNIEGTEIPEKDIKELKKMFDLGITFWHNYSTFRDYSQNNPIVT